MPTDTLILPLPSTLAARPITRTLGWLVVIVPLTLIALYPIVGAIMWTHGPLPTSYYACFVLPGTAVLIATFITARRAVDRRAWKSSPPTLSTATDGTLTISAHPSRLTLIGAPQFREPVESLRVFMQEEIVALRPGATSDTWHFDFTSRARAILRVPIEHRAQVTTFLTSLGLKIDVPISRR